MIRGLSGKVNLYRLRLEKKAALQHIPSCLLEFEKRLSSTETLSSREADPIDEDYLTVNSDPIGLSSSRYHPAVIRAFRETNTTHNKFYNQNVRRVQRLAEEMLIHLNARAHKYAGRPISLCYFSGHIEDIRRSAGDLALKILNEDFTDHDISALASSLAILMPQSEKTWVGMDNILTKASFGIDASLLVVHVLQAAKREYSLRHIQFSLPNELINQISKLEKKRIAIDLPGDEGSFDVFTPIGAPRVQQSRAAEKLGLYLEVLASASPPLRLYSSKHLLGATTELSYSVLSSLSAPVKIASLRHVWENASRLELPSSYNMYKILYEQVHTSISTEPLQLVHQEELVVTLLESMISAKFKNTRLINDVCMNLLERGMDVQRAGVRLFNALIELNIPSHALSILEELTDKAHMKAEQIFCPVKNKARKVSSDAKAQILDHLEKSKRKYESKDLMIALYCFNSFKKSSVSYKVLEGIEAEVGPTIDALSPAKAITILQCYSFAGRRPTGIVAAVDRVVERSFAGEVPPTADGEEPNTAAPVAPRIRMSTKELSKLLWANARLDHRAAYNQRAADEFIAQSAHLKLASNAGVQILSRTLWAMAVLEVLTYDHYLRLEPIFLRYEGIGDERQAHPFVVSQLRQALAELRINEHIRLAKNSSARNTAMTPIEAIMDSSSKTSSSSSSSKSHDKATRAAALRRRFQSVFSQRPWENTGSRMLVDLTSSFSHLDASNVLSSLGISHENEKVVEFGYVVDIYIPPGAVKYSGGSGPSAEGVAFDDDEEGNGKGVIIEFDGPYHFETYLQAPLGPTVMKRRHLQGLGYSLIALPYWKYKLDYSLDQKQKILTEHLRRIG